MSRLFKTALVGTASFVILSGVALASPKADLNQDNQIDRAEFIIAASAKFDLTDANFDGILTKDEIKARRDVMRAERRDREFEKLDTDKDGVISKAENDARSERHSERRMEMRLKRFDTDGDGTISEAEKAVAKEKFAERKANGEMSDGPKGKREGKRGHKDRIKRDANDDGVVTRAEFDAATEAMFDRLDANADGILTKGEGKHRKGPKGGRH